MALRWVGAGLGAGLGFLVGGPKGAWFGGKAGYGLGGWLGGRTALPDPSDVYGRLEKQARELYGTPYWQTPAGQELIRLHGEGLAARMGRVREEGQEGIEAVMHRRGMLGGAVEARALGGLEERIAFEKAEAERELWTQMYAADRQRQMALAQVLMQLGFSEQEAKIALAGMEKEFIGGLLGTGIGAAGKIGGAYIARGG